MAKTLHDQLKAKIIKFIQLIVHYIIDQNVQLTHLTLKNQALLLTVQAAYVSNIISITISIN